MQKLAHYKWYLFAAVMVAVTRWALMGFFALKLCSLFMPAFLETLISVTVGLVMVSGVSVFGICLWLRCPACGKRVLLASNSDNPEYRRVQALPRREQIKDIFLPSELSSRQVCCAHCGIWLSLRSET